MKKLFAVLTLTSALAACDRLSEQQRLELAEKSKLRKTQALVDDLILVKKTGTNLCFLARPDESGAYGLVRESAIAILVSCDTAL